MAGIFISYRREDSAPWAGRVYERLTHSFEREQIFMDVDNIAPGLDFVDELEKQVGNCDALVVILGKSWTDARNAKGERRLDDPLDFVRIELEAALQRNVRIIPILVDGATMPATDDLPPSLQRLARRNAVELTHARFGSDVQRLESALKGVLEEKAKQDAGNRAQAPPGPRSHVAAPSAPGLRKRDDQGEAATSRRGRLSSFHMMISAGLLFSAVGAAYLVFGQPAKPAAVTGERSSARDEVYGPVAPHTVSIPTTCTDCPEKVIFYCRGQVNPANALKELRARRIGATLQDLTNWNADIGVTLYTYTRATLVASSIRSGELDCAAALP